MLQELDRLLMPLFGSSNPVWVSQRISGPVPDPVLHRIAKSLRGSYRVCEHTLDVVPDAVRNQLALQTLNPVHHVFPVESAGEGFMIPLGVCPSGDGSWAISDAFGRMGRTTDSRPTLGLLRDTIVLIAKTWQAHRAKPLPIFWRRPMDLRVLAPVHLDSIEGTSCQLPILVALLRAIVANGSPYALPFGPQPVFCTGTVREDGTFDPVASVIEKARGFLREYGEGGCAAILLPGQEAELGLLPPSAFSAVYMAGDLVQLLALPPICSGLEPLTREPTLAEFDKFLQQVMHDNAFRQFRDVEEIAQWLAEHSRERPFYHFSFACRTALMKLHRGRVNDASPHLDVAKKCLESSPDAFGADSRIDYAAVFATYAFDTATPGQALAVLEPLAGELPYAGAESKARYWGTCSQIYRALHRYDEAVQAGEKSLDAAKLGALGEAHRDINYLVHAHIARARASQAAQPDLGVAALLLDESEGHYAPASSYSRGMHLVFCQHYRAEIQRLRCQPYTPLLPPRFGGDWQHPWMFIFLSAMLNEANGSMREEYARTLRDHICPGLRAPGALIMNMLCSLHEACVAAVLGENLEESRVALQENLATLRASNIFAWSDRLAPVIQALDDPGTLTHAIFKHVPYL